MNLIDKIALMKVPTNSVIAAVQNYNDRARAGEFGDLSAVLRNLVGDAVEPMKDPHTRVQVGYLIQETVTQYLADPSKIDVEALARLATRKAQNFVLANPWVFAADEVVAEPKVDAEGNVVVQRKRGAKQEHAAQVFAKMKGADKSLILKAFIDEVGLTKAGAQTYYYNLKKQAAE